MKRISLILVILSFLFICSCGGSGGEGNSNILPNEQEISELLDTQNMAKEFCENLEFEDDPNALQKTIDFLKEQENVEEAAIGEDNVSIWVRYNSGIEGIILTESFKPLDIDSLPRARVKNFISRYSVSESGKRAIILLPIDSVPKYRDESVDEIESYLTQSGYLVEIYRDQDVTVDLMRTLSNYDFVYMSAHGGVGPWGNVHIATGEIAHFNATAKLWSYLISVTSGITIFSYRGDNNLYFGLNSHFFDDYSYPGSLIYMNACSSLRRDNLADAFLENGASVFMGWSNISFLALSGFHNPDFFNRLTESNGTLKNAYDATIAIYYPCSVYKDDNRNGSYRVLLHNGLDLGDLEDATFGYTLDFKYKGNPDFILNPIEVGEGFIPDTGQDRCYDNDGWLDCPQSGEQFYGQDAQYNISPPSYSKMDSQGEVLSDSAASWVAVRDNITGLIWEVKTNDGGIHDKDNIYTWGNAQNTFIANLNSGNFGGHNDWRLPTIAELIYLANWHSGVDYLNHIDAKYFPHILSDSSYYYYDEYWSSTFFADSSSYGADCYWYFIFQSGYPGFGAKSDTRHAIAVRGEKIVSSLVVNGDGTVTDTATGLMWQQTAPQIPDTWKESLEYCEGLELAGHNDWRLPNIKELYSIMDYSAYKPSINISAFPGTKFSYHYWSSTTADDNERACTVDFRGTGYTTGAWTKQSDCYVRAVRNVSQ